MADEFPPELTSPSRALEARNAYQEELMARAEYMLEQPVPEDQPWAEVGLTLAIVYLVLHEDEEEEGGLPSMFIPHWRKKRRSVEESLALLEPHIRQYATDKFNTRQQELMERVRQRYPAAKKRWVSRRDARVRPTHTVADGQTVSVWEPFRVGESLLPYPGYYLGPPEEVMGCRCVVVFVP